MTDRPVSRLRAAARRWFAAIDGRDVHLYGGLALAVAGLWGWLGAPIAAVFVGGFLVYLAVWRM